MFVSLFFLFVLFVCFCCFIFYLCVFVVVCSLGVLGDYVWVFGGRVSFPLAARGL